MKKLKRNNSVRTPLKISPSPEAHSLSMASPEVLEKVTDAFFFQAQSPLTLGPNSGGGEYEKLVLFLSVVKVLQLLIRRSTNKSYY